ncbi:MAG: hypothetical protein AVDCRST_MAG60-2369 [uncultured Nocardioides sp.]|uniref:Uncharacterized protein n=1 Tax=uncultured Nocardioides sp. TaxID=198441 RepID=A0A6J4P6M3_9ACTN|nr:MAG: hypothetical protein AVDCRST_MAG60-2369 [uncultured Nocardioides sp.]
MAEGRKFTELVVARLSQTRGNTPAVPDARWTVDGGRWTRVRAEAGPSSRPLSW